MLGDLVDNAITRRHDRPAERALDCCLAWRWALSRTSETEMLSRLDVNAAGRELWAKVRPLVEFSWTASDTDRVIVLGREILSILGIPPGAPRRKLETAPYVELDSQP